MAGRDAFGTTISKGAVAVGNVTNISMPGLTREAYDVTAHDSTGAWREFIGGLKDGGEVSFDVNYDPTEHTTLVTADFAESDPQTWTIDFPEGSEWSFSAIVTSGESEAPHDGKFEGSITLKISGEPTFTEGS